MIKSMKNDNDYLNNSKRTTAAYTDDINKSTRELSLE